MLGRVGHLLFFSLLLFAITDGLRAACIDPAQLAHSTVSIMRHFDEAEREAHPNLVGVQGTGWYLSSTTLVSAEHVAADMNLSMQEWKPIEIMDEDGSQFIAVRIQRIVGAQTERLAVIELQRAVSNARSVGIRREPLQPEESVMTIGYPAGHVQLVSGRFVRLADDGRLTGAALLEFYEGDNRLIVDHGASGSPVLDCNGRVAAVVTDVLTQNISWAQREMRISTAWGMPNVVSVPAQALADIAQPDPKLSQQNSSAALSHRTGAEGAAADGRRLPNY
jgi:S1-C subfamily serine protease